MADLEFSIIVQRDGELLVEAPLGHRLVEVVAGQVADHPSQMILLDLLAEHPAAAVRRSVAWRDCLSVDRIAALAEDADLDVRRALIRSATFKRWVTIERLVPMAIADADLAAEIATDIHAFDAVEPDRLADALAAHQDPAVRAALASGYRTSMRILKTLAQDRDHEVALAALETISQR